MSAVELDNKITKHLESAHMRNDKTFIVGEDLKLDWSDKEIKDIISRWKEGWTDKDLIEHYECRPIEMHFLLMYLDWEHKIPLREYGVHGGRIVGEDRLIFGEEDKARLIRLYPKKTTAALSRIFDCSESYLKSVIKELGLSGNKRRIRKSWKKSS